MLGKHYPLCLTVLFLAACGPEFDEIEPDNVKYGVLGAVLDHFYADSRDATVRVVDNTAVNPLDAPPSLGRLQDIAGSARPSTLEDYLHANETPRHIRNRFDTEVSTRVVSEAWVERRKTSGSRRHVRFADVGLDESMTEAFVCFAEICGFDCARGWCTLLEVDDTGQWHVAEEMPVWIS
jgi:hypothetical protein